MNTFYTFCAAVVMFNNCVFGGKLMIGFLYQNSLNDCFPQRMVCGSLVCLGCDLVEPELFGDRGRWDIG